MYVTSFVYNSVRRLYIQYYSIYNINTTSNDETGPDYLITVHARRAPAAAPSPDSAFGDASMPANLLAATTSYNLHSPSIHRGIKSAGISQRSMVFSSVPSVHRDLIISSEQRGVAPLPQTR